MGEPPPSSLEEGDSAAAAAVHVAATTTGHQHLLSENTFLVNRVKFVQNTKMQGSVNKKKII